MSVSNSDLRAQIAKIVKGGDLEKLTLGKVIKQLEDFFQVDLHGKRKYINEQITLIINEMDDDDDSSNADSDDSNDMEISRQKKKPKKAKTKKTTKKKPGVSNLARPLRISKELAAFLEMDWTPELRYPRTEVVRIMCAYVKENNLQDPNDGRTIICDDRLQTLLGVENCTFFSLNKYVSKHFEKLPKKPVVKKKSGKPSGFNAPLLLSPALQQVIGEQTLSRPLVVKKLWEYIKENKLQDPDNGQIIVCDDRLAQVMKTDRINMMQMNKKLSSHMTKLEEPPENKDGASSETSKPVVA